MTVRLLPLVGLLAAAPAFAQPLPDPTDPRPPELELHPRIAPLLPAIREGLRGDDVDAQRAALGIIAEVPPSVAADAKLAPALADFLMKDRDNTAMTAVALRVFGASYPDPADISRVIGKHAKSSHTDIRRSAGAALAAAVDNATPPGRSLQNSAYFVDTARAAQPLVVIAMEDSDGATQRGGVLALEVVARVTANLYRFDPDLAFEEPKAPPLGDRFAPMNALLRGIAATVPKLSSALSSKDVETRIAAAAALEAISMLRTKVTLAKGPPEMERIDVLGEGWMGLQPVLKERITDPVPAVRLAVAEALETINDQPEAREILQVGANDKSIPVRWATARGLGRTASAKPSDADIATLGKLASDSDPDVRMTALGSLVRIGPAAAAAGPSVIASAGKGDTEPRVAAVKAITALQLPADKSLEVLIDGVNDADVRLRRAAAAALVRFGPAAEPALPALRKAVASPDPELRLTAGEAIFAIQGKRKLKDL